MKKFILILAILLTGCSSPKEQVKPENYQGTIILQDYQGDTLKVYYNVYIPYTYNTYNYGVRFKDQEGKEIHLQGGIITTIRQP